MPHSINPPVPYRQMVTNSFPAQHEQLLEMSNSIFPNPPSCYCLCTGRGVLVFSCCFREFFSHRSKRMGKLSPPQIRAEPEGEERGWERGKLSPKPLTQELFKQTPNLPAQSLPLLSLNTSPNPVLLTSTLAFPPIPHLPSLGEALAQRQGHLTHEETGIFSPIFMACPCPQPQSRTQKLLILQNVLVI